MISNDQFEPFSTIDLDAIKVKLMHESGEGWSAEQAARVDTEYRRFLYLMKAFPQEHVAPTVEVDTFWHYHILDTMKYAADCEHLFGYFLHHFPYMGMRGADDLEALERMGERMAVLYQQTFDVAYHGRARQANAASSADGARGDTDQAAYCIKSDQLDAARAGQAAYCIKPVALAAKRADQAAYCIKPVVLAQALADQAAQNAAQFCSIRPSLLH